MKKLIFIALLAAMAAGCRTTQPSSQTAEKVTVKTEIKEVLRDTTIFLTDSAQVRALVKCDSQGNAYLAEITALRLGKFARPHIKLNSNVMTLDCIVDSAAVYFAWHQRFERLETDTTVSKTVQVPVNYVTRWQRAQIWLGRVMIVLLITGFVFAIRHFTRKVSGI